MRLALKIFVCTFSFLFAFVAVAILFSLLIGPVGEALNLAGHKYTGMFFSIVVPFAIAAVAGYQTASKALLMENARQTRTKV